MHVLYEFTKTAPSYSVGTGTYTENYNAVLLQCTAAACCMYRSIGPHLDPSLLCYTAVSHHVLFPFPFFKSQSMYNM